VTTPTARGLVAPRTSGPPEALKPGLSRPVQTRVMHPRCRYLPTVIVSVLLLGPLAGIGLTNSVAHAQGSGSSGGQIGIFSASGGLAVSTDGSGAHVFWQSGNRLNTTGPVLSPDGTQVAAIEQPNPPNPEIAEQLVIGAGGGADRHSIWTLPGYSMFHPSWSPNGTMLAVAVNDVSAGDANLWVIDADGSSPREIASGLANSLGATWSSDGSRLGYAAQSGSSAVSLDTVAVSGGAPTVVTTLSAGESIRSVSWSPVANTILAVDFVPVAGGLAPEVDRYDLSTGLRQTILSTNSADPTWTAAYWSPDGTEFVTNQNAGGPNADLYSDQAIVTYTATGQFVGQVAEGPVLVPTSWSTVPPNQAALETAASPGYDLVASDGGLFTFATAFYGSMGGSPLNEPIVGMASTSDQQGYWLVAKDGGVFAFGDAPFLGSAVGRTASPVVGIASDNATGGYWVAAANGDVFGFGGAPSWSALGSGHLNAPIVGIASQAGGGFWLVAADGGVFSFGAPFDGSEGGVHLNAPVVGITADPATGGYWLTASDGGVFSFDAPFAGSEGGVHLNAPVLGIMADPATGGYWLTASDGGVFSFDAPFAGSEGGVHLNAPVAFAEAP
jgi:Tol biopolymer transport system component